MKILVNILNYPPGDPGIIEQQIEEHYGEHDEDEEEIEEEDLGRHWNNEWL